MVVPVIAAAAYSLTVTTAGCWGSLQTAGEWSPRAPVGVILRGRYRLRQGPPQLPRRPAPAGPRAPRWASSPGGPSRPGAGRGGAAGRAGAAAPTPPRPPPPPLTTCAPVTVRSTPASSVPDSEVLLQEERRFRCCVLQSTRKRCSNSTILQISITKFRKTPIEPPRKFRIR